MSQASAETAVQSQWLGRFIWYELNTTDVDAARTFYTRALGWGVDEFPMGDGPPYHVWTAGGRGIGGVLSVNCLRPLWTAYLYVEDVAATLRRAESLGGRVLVPATDIPEVGRFGVIADPQGTPVAVLKPIGEERPLETRKVGHVGWNELHTTDARGAWQFYSALFGWQQATSMPMGEYGDYSIFRHAADPADAWLGGLDEMAKHTHTEPLWLFYVNVERMAPALERISAGGGKVVNGPMEVPGGVAAHCEDPQGAAFGIFAPE